MVSQDNNNLHSWNKWERRIVTLAPQGGFLHSGIGFSRSEILSLFLGSVSFSILSGGNCLRHHFHPTTIGVSDNHSVINSGLEHYVQNCFVCLLSFKPWLRFSSRWAIKGILRPSSWGGRMVALIVSHLPSAAQPETDGWSSQDSGDWEASRTRADVAYTLVISREYNWL